MRCSRSPGCPVQSSATSSARRAGPALRLLSPVDRPAHVDRLVEADLAGVALGDRVGGDDADPASRRDRQVTEQEVGAQVGVARLVPADALLQVLAVVRAERSADLLAAHERGVADDGVEAAVGA